MGDKDNMVSKNSALDFFRMSSTYVVIELKMNRDCKSESTDIVMFVYIKALFSMMEISKKLFQNINHIAVEMW
jgi:hypothetical protein